MPHETPFADLLIAISHDLGLLEQFSTNRAGFVGQRSELTAEQREALIGGNLDDVLRELEAEAGENSAGSTYFAAIHILRPINRPFP